MKESAGGDLFDFREPKRAPYNGEAPFQKHSSTSAEAAKSVEKKIGPLHRRILDYLTEHRAGATDERLMSDLDLGGNTLRPRRRELQLMERIRDSGRTAKTKSGREAVIWVINV
jgi:hypothetical protein